MSQGQENKTNISGIATTAIGFIVLMITIVTISVNAGSRISVLETKVAWQEEMLRDIKAMQKDVSEIKGYVIGLKEKKKQIEE